ncbi:unnamed protein product [Orchesella dallaii]|uniref:Uncharacterized protein n=1 Tax=Orchesella dallaii TaxID=48710 RepID=A0ABP1S8G5_9HEXA
MVSEKTRKVARGFGLWYYGLNSVMLVITITALLVIAMLWTGYIGYNIYNSFASAEEEQISNGVDLAPELQELSQVSCPKINTHFAFGLYGTFTLGLLAISAPQHYGAYLLLQATNTKMNVNPTEALPKVIIHHRIQIANLILNSFGIVYIVLNHPGVFFGGLVLYLVLFFYLLRVFGIMAVRRYRKELESAAANDDKKTEKEKKLENKAKEAGEAVIVAVPE